MPRYYSLLLCYTWHTFYCEYPDVISLNSQLSAHTCGLAECKRMRLLYFLISSRVQKKLYQNVSPSLTLLLYQEGNMYWHLFRTATVMNRSIANIQGGKKCTHSELRWFASYLVPSVAPDNFFFNYIYIFLSYLCFTSCGLQIASSVFHCR